MLYVVKRSVQSANMRNNNRNATETSSDAYDSVAICLRLQPNSNMSDCDDDGEPIKAQLSKTHTIHFCTD